MKKEYVTPSMYMEAFIAEQYVAAGGCTQIISKTPPHGHVQIKNNEVHCAFTSSNCGDKATSCVAGQTSSAHSSISGTHQVITRENGTVITRPTTGHNCHILSDHDAAVAFAATYTDRTCGNGVAALMGLQDFEDIKEAWS